VLSIEDRISCAKEMSSIEESKVDNSVDNRYCPKVYGIPDNPIKDVSILKRLPQDVLNTIRDIIQFYHERQDEEQDEELIQAELQNRKPYILDIKEKLPEIGRSDDFHINFPDIVEDEKEEELDRLGFFRGL